MFLSLIEILYNKKIYLLTINLVTSDKRIFCHKKFSVIRYHVAMQNFVTDKRTNSGGNGLVTIKMVNSGKIQFCHDIFSLTLNLWRYNIMSQIDGKTMRK